MQLKHQKSSNHDAEQKTQRKTKQPCGLIINIIKEVKVICVAVIAAGSYWLGQP